MTGTLGILVAALIFAAVCTWVAYYNRRERHEFIRSLAAQGKTVEWAEVQARFDTDADVLLVVTRNASVWWVPGGARMTPEWGSGNLFVAGRMVTDPPAYTSERLQRACPGARVLVDRTTPWRHPR